MKAGASSDGAFSAGPKIGSGAVALVVGPSGAGKDALLAGARHLLKPEPHFVFVERVISRPAHAAEAHVSISEQAFREAARDGALAITWAAHGLAYGIPISMDEEVRRGRLAVFNASRGIIETVRARYAHVHVLLIDCPVEVRAQRLAARGREAGADIQGRLQRVVSDFDPASANVRIDNSGSLEAGVGELVRVLRLLADGG